MNTISKALAAVALCATAAAAGATTYSGNLGDAGNGALVGSDLGAPSFVGDDPAYNVALYTFTVSVSGTVSFASTGFAGGGVDPYFTLFAGSGNAATFLDSNYTQAYFGGGGDFNWTGTLAAGQYEFALGTFGNMSFAEQYGSPYTLGDGFISIPNIDSLGDGSYVVNLTTPSAPIPEPSQTALLGIGLAALATRACRGRRST